MCSAHPRVSPGGTSQPSSLQEGRRFSRTTFRLAFTTPAHPQLQTRVSPYADMYTPCAPRGLLLRLAVIAAAALLAAAQVVPMKASLCERSKLISFYELLAGINGAHGESLASSYTRKRLSILCLQFQLLPPLRAGAARGRSASARDQRHERRNHLAQREDTVGQLHGVLRTAGKDLRRLRDRRLNRQGPSRSPSLSLLLSSSQILSVRAFHRAPVHLIHSPPLSPSPVLPFARPPTSLAPPCTGARAKAWCLSIHAKASLSLAPLCPLPASWAFPLLSFRSLARAPVTSLYRSLLPGSSPSPRRPVLAICMS
jgi:hypothetical protein